MMARTSNKREKLLDSARALIHQQGFKHTTLADIAEHSAVPLGNVYYYFKTKDDLAAAVIADRKREMAQMAEQWNESFADPRDRLEALLDMALSHKETLAENGCPIGSLCQELNKDGGELAAQVTSQLTDQIDWTESQFRQLGVENPRASAIELIAAMQGIALMANSLSDAALVTEQIGRLRNRLRSL